MARRRKRQALALLARERQALPEEAAQARVRAGGRGGIIMLPILSGRKRADQYRRAAWRPGIAGRRATTVAGLIGQANAHPARLSP